VEISIFKLTPYAGISIEKYELKAFMYAWSTFEPGKLASLVIFKCFYFLANFIKKHAIQKPNKMP